MEEERGETEDTDRETDEDREQTGWDPAVYRAARDEAREIIDHQVDWAKQSDTDTARLIRFNILVAGLVVTAGSYVARNGASASVLLDPFFITSGFFWMISTTIAIVSYNSMKVAPGPFGNEDSIFDPQLEFEDDVVESSKTEREYYEEILRTYDYLLGENVDAVNTRYKAHVGVLSLLLWAVVGFALGVVNVARGLPTFAPGGYGFVGVILAGYFLWVTKQMAERFFLWPRSSS